jgi:hypothetical protein
MWIPFRTRGGWLEGLWNILLSTATLNRHPGNLRPVFLSIPKCCYNEVNPNLWFWTFVLRWDVDNMWHLQYVTKDWCDSVSKKNRPLSVPQSNSWKNMSGIFKVLKTVFNTKTWDYVFQTLKPTNPLIF